MRLRYSLLFALAAFLLAPAASAQSALVITGVADGPLSGGIPKAIEFYVAADIADLSTYGFGSANNADGTDGVEFAFPAVAASAGDVFYLASEAPGFTSFFGFAPDYTSDAANVNGDDSLELFYDANGVAVAPAGSVPATTSVVDVFGVVGTDGSGEAWEYLDGWAYRKAGTGPDGSTFVIANWTFSGVDALEGGTTNATTNTPFPIGTYGGSTTPVDAVTLTALLRGENEVPAADTDAKGGVTVVVDGTTVTVTGSFAGLTGNYAASHVHGGAAGENGGVVQALAPTVNADMRGGTFEAAGNTFTVRPTFADSIRAGLAYVNIHSATFGDGEIRGQINAETQSLPFALSGANEVPPNASPATGSGTVTLDGAMVTVTGSFGGLTGNYRFSHIHGGAAGDNGDVVLTLMATVDTDMRGGTFAADMNMFTARTSFADSIRAGLAYVNVHSDAFPGGEVRGQIGTMANLMTVTIAEARAQGAGATVQIEGTVTRAMGALVFLQDDTAGLAIRQLAPQAGAPALSAAVANGDVAPGTVLRVTGTLTEFNGLLQINSDVNDDNLASFEVIGTAGVPEAQIVTLAMIAANGESYESELVKVENVRFAQAGNGQFAARTTYQLTDASDATNAVAVRTPNADDTAIDSGVNIPNNLANVTGVVGQFDNSDPRDSGYQIQPIAADDVVAVVGVATEDGVSTEPTLTVANPLQGSTTVRFATGVAGRASLALYDALGRQVVTLVDGAVDGTAQTVSLDAGTLASGVYILRLQGEDVSISRTLTVVR